MKKILFLFLLAITSVGISGCGSSSESKPKQDTRTEIDLVPEQIVTITKEQEGKYIVQNQKVENVKYPIVTVNGEITHQIGITLEEGDKVMASNADYTTEVVFKLVPTK